MDVFKVYVRVKPVMKEDLKSGLHREAVTVCERDGKVGLSILSGKEKEKEKDWWFSSFDGLLTEATNQQVFDAMAKDLMPALLGGINATIMAYGQTGSGKTYTMFGSSESDMQQVQGLLHLALYHINEKLFIGSRNAQLSMSVFEVYNEELFSLLDAGGPARKKLERGMPDFYVHKSHGVDSVEEAVQLVMAALQLRAQDSTVRNQTSSRSHAFVKLQVVQPFAGTDGRGLSGTLYLVDLAGSESISHASSNEQQRETVHINKSLSALGRVVCNMSAQSAHIPYRDSLLTKVLQEGLDPNNARVALITTVSSFQADVAVTKDTLMFAQRARNVRTYAQSNPAPKRVAPPCPEDLQRQLQELQAINNALKQRLADLEGNQELMTYKRQLELMKQDQARLAEVVRELQQVADSSSRQQREAESALEQERAAHAATRERVAELKSSNEELQRAVAAAEAESKAAAARVAEVRSQATAAAVAEAALKGELAGAKALAEQLQAQHATAQEQAVQAREQLTALKGQLAVAEAGAGERLQQVQELEAQVTAARAEAAAARQAAGEVSDLEARIAELEQRLAQADAAAAAQLQQLGAAEAREADLREQLAVAQARVAELEAKLEEAQVRSAELWQQLVGSGAELDTAQSALEDKIAQLELLQASLARAEAQAAQHEERVRTLEAEAVEALAQQDQAGSEMEGLSERLAAAEAAAAGLQEQLQAAVAEAERQKEEGGKLQQELQATAAAAASHQEESSKLQQELQATAAETELQREESSRLQQALAAQLEAAEAARSAAAAELIQVQEQVAALRLEHAGASEAQQAASVEVQGLRQELAEAQAAASRQAAAHLAALAEVRAASEAAAAHKLEPLQADCERLQAQYSLAEEQLARLQEERDRLRQAESDAKESALRATAEVERLREALARAERESAERVARLEAQIERDVAPRRDANKALQERLRHLEADNKRMEGTHKGQLELKDKLIHQLEQMCNQLQAQLLAAGGGRTDTATSGMLDQMAAGSPYAGPARSDVTCPSPGLDDGTGTPVSSSYTGAGAAAGTGGATGRTPAASGILLLNRTTTASAAALARGTKARQDFTSPQPPLRAAAGGVGGARAGTGSGSETVNLITPPHAPQPAPSGPIDLITPEGTPTPADKGRRVAAAEAAAESGYIEAEESPGLFALVREVEKQQQHALKVSTAAVRNKMC
ncbi:hypothetical protein HYH02_000214 [Chlamydomonas schloesseri]|uniref:Kinesin motor domain-containing protein n=1 Tax=Chlamydomonas schloesseri TaxID=2026947 RepID=A0A836B7M0_9CHLO|nr:hypothetical protein HYH02_000214 [Chlamydomonas schloesseri]|eukprot:KAG2450111.1 hypothetical protein HYH02_000214 [Chlamydomonas schloesseri]